MNLNLKNVELIIWTFRIYLFETLGLAANMQWIDWQSDNTNKCSSLSPVTWNKTTKLRVMVYLVYSIIWITQFVSISFSDGVLLQFVLLCSRHSLHWPHPGSSSQLFLCHPFHYPCLLLHVCGNGSLGELHCWKTSHVAGKWTCQWAYTDRQAWQHFCKISVSIWSKDNCSFSV